MEHQIFSLGKMILHDRCSTLYDLASLFRGRRSTLDECKNRKTHWHEAVSSALNFSRNGFIFLLSTSKIEEARSIVSFLMLSSSKIEEVSQNCLVFDVVKFKK